MGQVLHGSATATETVRRVIPSRIWTAPADQGFVLKKENEETLTHLMFYESEKCVYASLGTTNLKLNRVMWDFFNLPKTFGTEIQHVTRFCGRI